MSSTIGSTLTDTADYQAHRAHKASGKDYKGNGCRYCDLEYRQKAQVSPEVISPDFHTKPGKGIQSYVIVNEPGLYSLILRSRKPQA